MARPLFWHQGLFLQPHHFQLQDRYIQSLLTPATTWQQPHFWGVGSVEIQDAALGNLAVNVVKGEFLFPNNTYVTFPGNGLISARSFEEDWVEGGKPLTTLVGLRKWNPAGGNVTILPSSDKLAAVATRFVTMEDEDDKEAPDLHQGGPQAQVKQLYYVLKLFWADEAAQLGDYDLIPLTQVVRHGEEILQSGQFIAPCLHIGASGPLKRIVGDIRDQLAARGHQLESYKRERGIHSAEFGSRDMVYLLALRSLNRYVPQLFHLTEAAPVHPWLVYGILRQIIGELSSFSDRVNVLGENSEGVAAAPAYDHRRLYSCFHGAQDLIIRLLDDITAGPEYMLQLLFDGTYYAADLAPRMFEGRNRYYLVLETELDPQQVLGALEAVVKLGSRESLPILIARALPGVPLTHLPVTPQELPRRPRAIYLQIDHHSEHWMNVQKSNNLGLFWDTAPEDFKAELMVVGRTG
ncbi:MAG: type VI secretion system baseplate subunit TssK [Desulfobacterales bacterium]